MPCLAFGCAIDSQLAGRWRDVGWTVAGWGGGSNKKKESDRLKPINDRPRRLLVSRELPLTHTRSHSRRTDGRTDGWMDGWTDRQWTGGEGEESPRDRALLVIGYFTRILDVTCASADIETPDPFAIYNAHEYSLAAFLSRRRARLANAGPYYGRGKIAGPSPKPPGHERKCSLIIVTKAPSY
jgi:hypothetical protein